MKVHHYSKALSWITRPRVTETATLQTYIPELERMDFNPGGRVEMKPGGIVEPRVGLSGGKLVTIGPDKGKYRFWYGTYKTGTYKTYYAKSPEEGKAWVKKQSTDFQWLKKGISIEDAEKRIVELGKTGEHTKVEILQVLKDEGYVKPSKLATVDYTAAKSRVHKVLTTAKIKVPTITDIQGNVFMRLVKEHPKVDTIQGIAELAQKELNLEQVPYQTVKRWTTANKIKLLTMNEKIFPEIKALDKLVKNKKSKFENIQRGFGSRYVLIENNANAIGNALFSEMKKQFPSITKDQLTARLGKLDALYSGRLEPGTTFATDIYKAIKPIKNYEKSKFKKGFFATVKGSGYTSVLQEAQMLGLPDKDIQLLTDVLKGSRKLSRVKIAGDHTDSNALMRAVLNDKNWNVYKKDFMRINVISNTLNKIKMPFDKRISEAYKNWKINKISQPEFNAIVQDTKEALLKKTKIPIGNPKIVNGEFQFNFLTERMGDLKHPRNKAVLSAMNNLVKQSGVKFKGIDQELRFANNVKERFDILKNAGIDQLKNSKYLKAFANMSGELGKAAKVILKTKAGKIGAGVGIYSLLSGIAGASEKDEKGEIDVDEVTKSGMSMPTVKETVAALGLSKLLGKVGGADPLKYFRKVPRKILSSLATPTGALAAWPLAAMGAEKLTGEKVPVFDPKDPWSRGALGLELGLAPSLVTWTEKLTKPIKNQALRSGVQKGLNLLMNPKTAMRAARYASPVGWAALGLEGAYQGGKFMYKDYQKRKDAIETMWKEDPEKMQQLALEASETMRDDTSAMFNTGGRAGFKKGTKFSPGRRLFIQGVGAAALLPIVGKYFKLAKPVTKAFTGYTGPIIEKIKGLEWVQFLAKRLWNEGDDVTKTAATAERQVVKRGTLEGGDEVDMVYDMDSGNVRFEVSPKPDPKTGYGYQTKSGAYNDPYGIEYKAPEVIEEGKHAGKKTKPEIDVGEAEPHQVSPEDVELEGVTRSVDDAASDLTELEAFAKKKTTKQIHKKKGTKPKDVAPEWEPPDWDDLDIGDLD